MAFKEVSYFRRCDLFELTTQQRAIAILTRKLLDSFVAFLKEVVQELIGNVNLGVPTMLSVGFYTRLATGVRVGPNLLKGCLTVIRKQDARCVTRGTHFPWTVKTRQEFKSNAPAS